MIIDTHTHLYSEQFKEDRDRVFENALNEGISRFFIPAIDSSYYSEMVALETKYKEYVRLMIGLHPTSVKENFKEELQFVKDKLTQRNFYAIGEIGIDLYWDTTFLKEQQEAFQTQIKWAKERKLPIIIHCRNAFDEIFEILDIENDGQLFGIFHCFTGTLEQAKKIIDYGFLLGIGGVVTFKKGKIDAFLNQIPLEHIVLETDSPYLAPSPFRGKRNESSYLKYIIEKMASLYDISTKELIKQTTLNALKIIGN